ncbi:MAG: hypothetical protein JST60_13680 [Chloroflexi bacterium SZAS-1]|jgi:hypothetical protein|nr:hypothetical protein [Chloroflexi bacterium SZAS-1]HNP85678.1 hypothetical protein [Kouleothrix sp.]
MISISIFGTQVKAKKIILLIIVAAVWASVTLVQFHWHPERGFWQGLLIGLVTTLFLLIVEFGHDLAHIVSARYAGAPMDEILISADMPRTLYSNNAVSPNVHRMRALGGPIFNIMGLLLSLAIYRAASSASITKELAGWWAFGHGLQLMMSLLPLPPVDGGTILKWTLVARGKTESEADKVVGRVDWILGSIVILAGIGLIFVQKWTMGLILLGVGGIVFGVAAGKIR